MDKKKRTPEQNERLLQLHAQRKACVAWEVSCPESYALIMAGNTLLLGSENTVTALSGDSGQVTWTSPVKGKAYGLAVADDSLFVSTDQGTIYCFGEGPLRYFESSQDKPSLTAKPGDRQAQAVKQLAQGIIRQSTVRKGYCLVLGSGQGQLACELAHQSELSIVGVEEDARHVRSARKRISDAGLYGQRLCIFQGNLKTLPFQDYVANLIVLDLSSVKKDRLPEAEGLHRLLRPGGGALALMYSGDALMEQRIRVWAKDVFNDL
ncbi:MAG: methyltransferase domain-containing protein, partial [Planctomycetes bacterium]|nr:methyltransferase domain-containing protein [Planctomycetota bacterium]